MTVTHEVAGSIPVRVAFAFVAQLVERMPEEHGVAGSTPAEGTSSVSSNGRTPASDAGDGSSILSAEINNNPHASVAQLGEWFFNGQLSQVRALPEAP